MEQIYTQDYPTETLDMADTEELGMILRYTELMLQIIFVKRQILQIELISNLKSRIH